MSTPPRDPDDIESVLDQVSSALDALLVVDGDERDALLGSLREVLGGTTGPVTARAEVTVLDGGLGAESSPAPRPRPALRLAEEDCADPDTHSESEDPDLGAPLPDDLLRRLRVIHVGRVADDDVGGPAGNITLPAVEGGTSWQTLFVGTTPRTYRVRCDSGVLTLHAARTAVTELYPGQSVDIEAKRIRVSAEGPAEGRYLRLHR